MTGTMVRAVRRTGSAHRHCQDRYRVISDGDRLILAVADGHGGRPYVRSGLGARMACAAAAEVLLNCPDPAQIPGAIKDRYDGLVARHLALRPLADWELERLGGRPPAEAYGTTLLAALVGPDSTGLFQLGDGDLHALDLRGDFFPALPADAACVGNLTTSLASGRDHVLAHFRAAWFPAPAAALVMFTDGCDGGLLRAVRALADPEGPEEQLRELFRETAHGDDQTLLLVCSPEADGEDFRAGLGENIRRMEEKRRLQRQERRDRAEYAELKSYLRLALRKAERMRRSGDPALGAYLDKLEPSFRRMNELRERLEPTPLRD